MEASGARQGDTHVSGHARRLRSLSTPLTAVLARPDLRPHTYAYFSTPHPDGHEESILGKWEPLDERAPRVIKAKLPSFENAHSFQGPSLAPRKVDEGSLSDSETIGDKLERKGREFANILSSFVELKRRKMDHNASTVDQSPPAFSYHAYRQFWRDTHFKSSEAEYLFHLFRRCTDYPKEHMPLDNFRNHFWPTNFDEESSRKLFVVFQDMEMRLMGLQTISFTSFMGALSIIGRGTPRERAQFLARVCFALADVAVYPENSRLAAESHSVTASKEDLAQAILSLSDIQLPSLAAIPTRKLGSAEGKDKYAMHSPTDEDLVTDDESDSIYEATEDSESLSEMMAEKSGNYTEVVDDGNSCCFRDRLITMVALPRLDREKVSQWVTSYVELLPEQVTYKEFWALIESHLADTSTPKRDCDTCYRTLFENCFGIFPYFRDLILDTMESDLAALGTPNLPIMETEGFLVKNWEFGPVEKWKKHWCIIRDGFFWYYDCHVPIPCLDDPERVVCLQRANVEVINEVTFAIYVPGYSRKFRAETKEEAEHWVKMIRSHSTISPNLSSRDGFSPIRHGINTQWYVDGEEGMLAILGALRQAKEQIFIADWFLSPYVHLKRPMRAGVPFLEEEDRLDRVLLERAQAGVRVYILPWNETKIVIDLGSAHAEEYFNSLHENIQVLRHPSVTPIYWTHHQKIVVVDQSIAFVGGLDLCLGRWDTRSHDLVDCGMVKRWPGKDYYNPLYCELEDVHDVWSDLVDRDERPRMPWHDVHMRVNGSAARDVARNFIQRWNHHKEALASRFKYLTPNGRASSSSGYNSVQVLRSLSDWSAGIGAIVERSIYEGYIQAIKGARHFIYIENQFFIGSLASNSIKNRLAECIGDKIAEAILNGREFKVIIIIPQHPEGGFYKDDMTTAYIMHLQYQTISRGGNSLLERIRQRFPMDIDLDRYIGFFSLRNYDYLHQHVVTEQIYVHAKLLIVDDRVAIIGSANTNDRSMFGDRDSEIAIKTFGGETISTTMGGQSWRATKFVHTLRVSLMQEHLGMLDQDPALLEDPMYVFDHLWWKRAHENLTIYKIQFPRIPSSVNKDSYIARRTHETETRIIRTDCVEKALEQIQGHLVEFDLGYTGDYNLDAGLVDAFVDESLFS